MFNKTYEFQKIKKELEAINALDEYALFECYGDSIATFGFRKYSAYHQFCVISHDSFSREIQLADLLELKRITFFSHAVFLEKLGIADERLDSVSWSMYESSGLN